MKIKKKTASILTVASYITSAVFFISLSPEDLPVSVLLFPFALIFVTLYLTLYTATSLLFKEVTPTKRMIIVTVASMTTLLALIQSVTQLTIRDVTLAFLIVVIMVWYLGRSSGS